MSPITKERRAELRKGLLSGEAEETYCDETDIKAMLDELDERDAVISSMANTARERRAQRSLSMCDCHCPECGGYMTSGGCAKGCALKRSACTPAIPRTEFPSPFFAAQAVGVPESWQAGGSMAPALRKMLDKNLAAREGFALEFFAANPDLNPGDYALCEQRMFEGTKAVTKYWFEKKPELTKADGDDLRQHMRDCLGEDWPVGLTFAQAITKLRDQVKRLKVDVEVCSRHYHHGQHDSCPDCDLTSGNTSIAREAKLKAEKDGAYLERNCVVAALAKCFPSGIAKTAIDGWSEDWHGCVYIDLPTGQASWHYHTSQAYLFDGLPPYTGNWDGHTTEEKYARLAKLQPASSAREFKLNFALKYAIKIIEQYELDIRAAIAAGKLPEGYCQGIVYKDALADIERHKDGLWNAGT